MENKAETTSNRKEQILSAAAELFANKGYYKTTTSDVARAVGVTQPYVFYFFKTKEELYLAVLQKAKEKLVHAFSSVESQAEQLQKTMGGAFESLLESNRNEMLLVMTAFATPEPEIRDFVRAEFDEVYDQVNKRFTEAGFDDPDNKAREFIAYGLVITLAEVLQLPKLFPWCKS